MWILLLLGIVVFSKDKLDQGGLRHCPNLLQVFKGFIYLFFRERGREGESEGEKHQCVGASHVAPTGDLACNPGMCPDWDSNGRPFGLQPVLSPLSYTSQGSFTFLMIQKKCSSSSL